MPATGRRFTGRSSARVFVVSWRCREVELSGRLTMRRCSCYLRLRASLMMAMMTSKTNVRPVDAPAVTDRDKH
jgi:hypothetical protein